MKILIAADMEGITGVVAGEHVTPGHFEYGRFRSLMTQDVNAAIAGAYEAGAAVVNVSDGHWDERNILIEALDPRARLNSGTPAPFSMVQGIESGVNGVLFIGYHARSGTQNAILDHTWSTSRIADLCLNGMVVGEIGLNAALCGHFGAPVLMISGDQSACAEATALLGPLETAVVKHATGRTAAECLTPTAAHERIRAAARAAVERMAVGNAPARLAITTPITVAIEFKRSDQADGAMLAPGAVRVSGRRVEITAPDMPAAYCAFRTLVGLARE